MNFRTADVVLFVGYFLVVAVVAVVASRKEERAEDYFLAGRALPWWLIGISLVASNISTEHFVGMAGSGVDFGLAIASYEWMAAITLVVVARWFLPRFLEDRITTMPEYLERRFDGRSRTWLAAYMLLAYVFVAMATVLYSGGLALETIFGLPLWVGVVILAAFAGAYTIYGGLKAVVWSDLVQGVVLVVGGTFTAWYALREVGGMDALVAAAPEKFHTVLPLDHPELPWFAVFFGGLWIANIFYWGCNQFITQRALAARDVRQGRYGVLFAAYIKLAIPLIVVIPGIAAGVLYGDELARSDMAYPMLVARLLPAGLAGLIFAALLAAIMSSLDSMLNSAATIFTMDVYERHVRPGSSHKKLIRVGRSSTLVFLVLSSLWAPFLVSFERIFSYIQEFWGLITPGVAVVFIGGLFWRKASATAATWVMVATLPVTIGVKLVMRDSAFLDQMWVAGLLLAALMVGRSLTGPSDGAGRDTSGQPGPAPDSMTPQDTATPPDRLFDVLCVGVVLVAGALYLTFF